MKPRCVCVCVRACVCVVRVCVCVCAYACMSHVACYEVICVRCVSLQAAMCVHQRAHEYSECIQHWWVCLCSVHCAHHSHSLEHQHICGTQVMEMLHKHMCTHSVHSNGGCAQVAQHMCVCGPGIALCVVQVW